MEKRPWKEVAEEEKLEIVRMYLEEYLDIRAISKIFNIDTRPISNFLKEKSIKLRGSRLTSEEFIERAVAKHGELYDYSQVEYSGSYGKVNIICVNHGVFNQIAREHIRGSGCPFCHWGLDQKVFLERSKLIHGNKYDYSKCEYKTTVIKTTFICPEHGEFKQSPASHLRGEGCSICGRESKGEKEIAKILELNSIEFYREKTFNDCRHPETNQRLRFDFYLPVVNLIIEYDGIQHFKPIKHWGGQKALDSTRERDQIKTNYCETVGITLLRISYLEDIKESLTKVNIFG